jgi:hypothetical protein
MQLIQPLSRLVGNRAFVIDNEIPGLAKLLDHHFALVRGGTLAEGIERVTRERFFSLRAVFFGLPEIFQNLLGSWR